MADTVVCVCLHWCLKQMLAQKNLWIFTEKEICDYMSENLSVSSEVEKYKYIRKISLKNFVFTCIKFDFEALLLPS